MKTKTCHRKQRSLLLLLALFCMLLGCTQNNGHIGPIFGSWALTRMTQDGVPLEINTEDETVVSFQNEIVKIVRLVNFPYSSLTRYGNFTQSDKVLTMKFQIGPTSSGSNMYTAPDWLHFPQNGEPIHFKVEKLNGSEMELRLDSGGSLYVYLFKKTW